MLYRECYLDMMKIFEKWYFTFLDAKPSKISALNVVLQ